MGHLKARLKGLRLRLDKALKCLSIPMNIALFGRFPPHYLAFFCWIIPSLCLKPPVFDHMLGSHSHHISDRVKSTSTGPSTDLMKIPRTEDPGFLAVILAQLGEQHGADRNIHPYPKRVRPTDNFE
ncbi:MAG: hypothetical protein BWY82_01663 [Verrucomicrobia bacterium ADurb.Bin474]|nr:MAG: hypothetical protein BWY82_01663 [Verrucomicrobia bacterium ADurb.Bin474]